MPSDIGCARRSLGERHGKTKLILRFLDNRFGFWQYHAILECCFITPGTVPVSGANRREMS